MLGFVRRLIGRHRPRSVYDVMAAIACFGVVAGGTAYAANTVGSSDIIDGQVRNADLAPNAVTTDKIKDANVTNPDLADNAVGRSKIAPGAVLNNNLADGSVDSAKIFDGSVGTRDLATGAVTADKLAPNAVSSRNVQDDSLTGADINEASLDLSQAPLPAAAYGTGECNADSGVLTSCASTQVTTPKRGRLLVNGTGTWTTFRLDDTSGLGADTDETVAAWGTCWLAVDGSVINSIGQTMGERDLSGEPHHNSPGGGTMALTAVSGDLAPGTHTVEVDCLENDGDLDWKNIHVTAALVARTPASASAHRAPRLNGAPDTPAPGKDGAH
jgi:hypothetical protein